MFVYHWVIIVKYVMHCIISLIISITPGSRRKIAIFILNYNGITYLGNELFTFIDSAFLINYPDYDVVIIDNNSADNSYEELSNRYGKDAIIIKLNRNYGYTGGNELGFRIYVKERGIPRYAVFMNNDYKIENPDFLTEVIKGMEEECCVGLAQGITLRYASKDVISTAGSFVTNLRNYPRGAGLKVNELPELKSYISNPHGACFVIKPKVILEKRPFIMNPRLFGYNEVVELGLDMWTHGIKSAAYPVIMGRHKSGSTFGRMSAVRTYLKTRNEVVLDREIMSKVSPGYIIPALTSLMIPITYMPLRGSNGFIRTRAIIDGLRESRYIFKGEVYPLIIIFRGFKAMIGTLPGAIKRTVLSTVWSNVENEIIRLTITKETLRSSTRPFMVMI